MRRLLLCGVAIIGMALQASAADMPDLLRGSSTVITAPGGTRWDGFYIGGHVGASVPGIDFTNNTGSVAAVLDGTVPIRSRSVSPLGNQDSTATHFGGFAGYQQQWDGAVVGVEGTYNWIGKSVSSANTITGAFGVLTDNLTYIGAGSATARIVDYGTLRLRGGWAAGSFMPYATFGLAMGRMDITRAVVVTPSATATSPVGAVVPPPFTVSETLANQFGYGWAGGVGVDFCLMANLFMRAEYEYVQFPDYQGLNVHMHNVRVGAALKF